MALFLGADDAAVRDRGAADRAVPRPVQPRPPLGDRRHDGDPRVPLLGARHRRGHRLDLAVPGRARRPGRVQGVRRDPRRRRTPPAARSGSPWSRPTPGSPCPASSAPPSPRRSPAWRRWPGPEWSLRYAFVLFVIATICAIRLPDAGRLQQRRGHAGAPRGDGEPSSRPAAGGSRIPAAVAFALRANCGPRWLSGFLTMFMAFLLRENPIGDWEPAGPARARDRRGRARQHPRHRRRVDAQAVNPALTVVLALVADARGRCWWPRCSTACCSLALLGAGRPGSASRWRSCRWTRPSSATCPSGCRPARSRAATPRCSWRG